jgi:hypothetical protein
MKKAMEQEIDILEEDVQQHPKMADTERPLNFNEATTYIQDDAFPEWLEEKDTGKHQIYLKGMDPQSRVLIEAMLAEEAYYFGSKITNHYKPEAFSEQEDAETRKIHRISASTSSSELPSHNTRWTEEENQRLMEGIQKFGVSRWSDIADYVGTRNPLQVKNRARHVLYYKKDIEYRKNDDHYEEESTKKIPNYEIQHQEGPWSSSIEETKKREYLVEITRVDPKGGLEPEMVTMTTINSDTHTERRQIVDDKPDDPKGHLEIASVDDHSNHLIPEDIVLEDEMVHEEIQPLCYVKPNTLLNENQDESQPAEEEEYYEDYEEEVKDDFEYPKEQRVRRRTMMIKNFNLLFYVVVVVVVVVDILSYFSFYILYRSWI